MSTAIARRSDPSEPKSEATAILELTLAACVVARRAVEAATDGVTICSKEIYNRVSDMENELDVMDREIDNRVTLAIGSSTPEEAQILLTCMKFIVDLERIGDLILSMVSCAGALGPKIGMEDVTDLVKMCSRLEKMLTDVHQALQQRKVDLALDVLRADAEIDRLRNLMMIRHLERADTIPAQDIVQILFMAQSLERAGDHAKNLAEEVCHFISGQSIRHLRRQNCKTEEQMYLEWLRAKKLSEK
jgi:phosphate transport system protein